MSGIVNQYNSPIDFRISQSVLNESEIEPGSRPAFNELYAFAFQVVRAFVDFSGIGQQNFSNWAILAGNTKTLLAGNLNRLYVIASEAISFGAAISLFNSGGVLQVRNANATNNTKICDGFCSTIGGITAGATGEIILNNGVANIGGLVIGSRYWLSTTNGIISNAPAVAAGNVEQLLGIAISSTVLSFNISNWFQH
jgi:hypothetical protein